MIWRPLALMLLMLMAVRPALAESRNDAARIPELYWGIRSRQVIPRTSTLLNVQEEFQLYSFKKNEVVIPYPLKAHFAANAAERYWSVGNRIYRYDPTSKQSQTVATHFHQMGEWKLWRVREVELSPTGKYISFREEFVDVTGEPLPKFLYAMAVMDLNTKRVVRFLDASWLSAHWSPTRDRLAYVPSCQTESPGTPCRGLTLINADGTKPSRILTDTEIHSFNWLDGETLLFGHSGPYNDELGGHDPMALKRYARDGSVDIVYDFQALHGRYVSHLYGLWFTEQGDRFFYWVDRAVPEDQVGLIRRMALFMGNLRGEATPVLDPVTIDGLGAPRAQLSLSGTHMVVQICGEHSDYCEDTRIMKLATGQSISIPGAYDAYWLDDERLLLVKGVQDAKTFVDRVVDATLLQFGEPETVTYYRLDVGREQGLKRGDIFSVYAKARVNAITGDEDGVDKASVMGSVILTKVEAHIAWAINYDPSAVEFRAGYLVNDGRLTGRITGIEKLKDKF